MNTLSNAARVRMLARLLSKVMEHQAIDELKIPLAELDSAHDIGLAVENGVLIVALGDKNG